MRTVFSSRALRRPAAARRSSRTSVLVMVVEEDLFGISRSPLRVASSSDLHPTPGSLEINFSADSRGLRAHRNTGFAADQSFGATVRRYRERACFPAART